MADVNINKRDSFMATPTLKSNTGSKGMQEKKSIMFFSVRMEKSYPSGSLMMPISVPRADFSIRTSHS